ncbi:hypothetical protein D3C78_1086210 [compost metagenome]
MLAEAGLLAVRQRAEHRGARVQAGEDVGQRHADLHRPGALLAGGAPGQAHQPAEALDHEVVAGALGVGAVLAEAGDRAVDQPRVDLFQTGVVEAVGGQAADLEILQQDVRLQGQLADDALALLAGEVDGQRLLVAVGAQVIGRFRGVLALGVAQERRPPVTGVVACAWALDLEHLGAEIGEDLPGPGAGQHAGQVEDADMRQGAGHGGTSFVGRKTTAGLFHR